MIAPSFADIFYNNCFNVGILPVRLPSTLVQSLFEEVETTPGYTLTIDLMAQSITTPTSQTYPFEIVPFRRETLLYGLDAIGHTLQFEPDIAAFEDHRNAATPWYDAPVLA